MFGLRLGLRTI